MAIIYASLLFLFLQKDTKEVMSNGGGRARMELISWLWMLIVIPYPLGLTWSQILPQKKRGAK